MNTELQDALEYCLTAAENIESELAADPSNSASADPSVTTRTEWIKRQLANLTAKLKAIKDDIEAGLSLSDMEFMDPQEMQDQLSDMSSQIAQLRSMYQALSKGLCL